jgi:hypothetical protein
MNRRQFIAGTAAAALAVSTPIALAAPAARTAQVFWFHRMSDFEVAMNWLWVANREGKEHPVARALNDEMGRRNAAHAVAMAA